MKTSLVFNTVKEPNYVYTNRMKCMKWSFCWNEAPQCKQKWTPMHGVRAGWRRGAAFMHSILNLKLIAWKQANGTHAAGQQAPQASIHSEILNFKITEFMLASKRGANWVSWWNEMEMKWIDERNGLYGCVHSFLISFHNFFSASKQFIERAQWSEMKCMRSASNGL